MLLTHVAFPGLGIGPFDLNRVAFTVFGRPIMWYGILITIGIFAAFFCVKYRANRFEGVKTDDLLDYAIYVVVAGVIGARLYYVVNRWDAYRDETLWKTLYNVIAVWEGGLAIYGGIILGGIALVIVSLVKKIKVSKALDMIAPGVMLGQLIGRWGNFFNGEAYGWSPNVASLPWRMQLEDAYRSEYINGVETRIAVDFVHPTFLYESLWNLIGFLIIQLTYKRKKFDGQIFWFYLTWYGFGRMFIEGLRTDSLMVGDFRISQIVAFLCFFIGLAVLIAMAIVLRLRRSDNKEPASAQEGGTVSPAAAPSEPIAGAAPAIEEKAPAAAEEAPEQKETDYPGVDISEQYSDDPDDEP